MLHERGNATLMLILGILMAVPQLSGVTALPTLNLSVVVRKQIHCLLHENNRFAVLPPH